MSRYGFEFTNGREAQVEADSIHEAIIRAEADSGSRVMRGRCLDNYDADSTAGRYGAAAFQAAQRRRRQE